jgi:hypothetical protein
MHSRRLAAGSAEPVSGRIPSADTEADRRMHPWRWALSKQVGRCRLQRPCRNRPPSCPGAPASSGGCPVEDCGAPRQTSAVRHGTPSHPKGWWSIHGHRRPCPTGRGILRCLRAVTAGVRPCAGSRHRVSAGPGGHRGYRFGSRSDHPGTRRPHGKHLQGDEGGIHDGNGVDLVDSTAGTRSRRRHRTRCVGRTGCCAGRHRHEHGDGCRGEQHHQGRHDQHRVCHQQREHQRW